MDARSSERAPSADGTRRAGVRADDIVFGGLLGLFAYAGTAAALVALLAPDPPDASWRDLLAERPAVLIPRQVDPEEAPTVLQPAEPPPLTRPPERVAAPELEVRPDATTPEPREAVALHSEEVRRGLFQRMQARRGGARDDAALLLEGITSKGPVGELEGATRARRVGPGDLGPADPTVQIGAVGTSRAGSSPPDVDVPDASLEPPVAPDDALPEPTVTGDALPPSLQARFRTCYEVALRAHPGRSGRLSVTLEVEDERVVDVSLGEDTLGLGSVSDCVRGSARRWRARRYPDGVLGPWSLVFRAR